MLWFCKNTQNPARRFGKNGLVWASLPHFLRQSPSEPGRPPTSLGNLRDLATVGGESCVHEHNQQNNVTTMEHAYPEDTQQCCVRRSLQSCHPKVAQFLMHSPNPHSRLPSDPARLPSGHQKRDLSTKPNTVLPRGYQKVAQIPQHTCPLWLKTLWHTAPLAGHAYTRTRQAHFGGFCTAI